MSFYDVFNIAISFILFAAMIGISEFARHNFSA